MKLLIIILRHLSNEYAVFRVQGKANCDKREKQLLLFTSTISGSGLIKKTLLRLHMRYESNFPFHCCKNYIVFGNNTEHLNEPQSLNCWVCMIKF